MSKSIFLNFFFFQIIKYMIIESKIIYLKLMFHIISHYENGINLKVLFFMI